MYHVKSVLQLQLQLQEQRGQHQADTGHGTSGKNEGTVPSQ